MKILIAIPTYDGKLFVEGVRCLIEEHAVAAANGDELLVKFLPSCSHPAMGRNQLAHEFMESDAERLVFLDSDLTWALGALVRVAHQPVDFVGGGYRFKFKTENYPVGWLTEKDELWSDENGLIEVASLPTGFLSLSRKVFDDFREHYGDRWFTHFDHSLYCYFSMPWVDGEMYGEDSFFCKEYRDMGGKIYLDPGLGLAHWDGNIPYPGNIGEWLKNRGQETSQSLSSPLPDRS